MSGRGLKPLAIATVLILMAGYALVVWPESAVPAYLDLVTDFLGEQATRAAANNSTLILGIPTRNASDADGRGYDAFNSLVALGADHGIYHKRHLVPFGEYVPLESWLRGLIAFFDLPMSSFSTVPKMAGNTPPSVLASRGSSARKPHRLCR